MTTIMVAESAGVVVTMDVNNMILDTDVMRLRISGMVQMVVIGKQSQRHKGQDQQPADTLFAGTTFVEYGCHL